MLNDYQLGFWEKNTTSLAITELIDEIIKSLEYYYFIFDCCHNEVHGMAHTK